MTTTLRRLGWTLAIAFTTFGASFAAEDQNGTTFDVSFSSKIQETPINARVYVMLAPASGAQEPRFGPNWFSPQPFFAVDAKGWKPGETLRFDDRAAGFPGPLSTLKAGKYRAQAVVRLNLDTHKIGDGPGNLFGAIATIEVEAGKPANFSLPVVDKVVVEPKFEETDTIKLIDIPSPILSKFYKRPIRQRAALIAPKGALEPGNAKKYPTLYIIPGFGGDHTMARFMANAGGRGGFARDFIGIVLDPDCYTGHHVFADSATNGPRGRALVEEMIPYIEKHYPAIADPRARLLNGHSSGGWSSLWLQVSHPDDFGGTWSTSPDPVDFRDFQRIDLYSPNQNMFHDRQGERRPLARMGEKPVLFYENFSRMEDVIGDGGQLHSFEAVFSPLDKDGRPRPLYDPKTGAVDLETAKAWEKYDIRLVLERNWKTLGPKLKGKLHVYNGSLDTFYLEGATKLLKESLEKLGSDAVVEIFPGKDHGSILDAGLVERLDREMHERIKSSMEK
ncbi:MAG: alpha/beta hydrolase-fold protein [Isosphaeraceae bacterium]